MKIMMIAAAVSLFAGTTMAQDADVKKELVPTGKLRVGIAVGKEPSGLFVLKEGDGYKGVAIELGKGMAAKLGVPVEFVAYQSSPEIIADANASKWDVTFMPVDEARKKIVDFGAPYHVLQSTYMVAPGSKIQTLEEVRAGVRVAGIDGTATFRAAQTSAKDATFIHVPSPAAAAALLQEGKADAIAFSREALTGFAAKIPGARILDGGFLNSTTAVAVPKGRTAALAYVTAYVEEAKASGLVRKAFDSVGLTASTVAPAGMKP